VVSTPTCITTAPIYAHLYKGGPLYIEPYLVIESSPLSTTVDSAAVALALCVHTHSHTYAHMHTPQTPLRLPLLLLAMMGRGN